MDRSNKINKKIHIASNECVLEEGDVAISRKCAKILLDGLHYEEYHRCMRYSNVTVNVKLENSNIKRVWITKQFGLCSFASHLW
jgi:hypothetical protein